MRKGRASNASRLSTQSNFTAVSEGTTMAEADIHDEEGPMLNAEPIKPAKGGNAGKRAPKSRKKVAKAQKETGRAKQDDSLVNSSFSKREDDDIEIKNDSVHEEGPNNKKRKSEEISLAATGASSPALEGKNQPPPAKRRATRSRNTLGHTQDTSVSAVQQNYDNVDVQMTDGETMAPPLAPVVKEKGKGRKKRETSTTRKASNVSTASKASLRATIPNDEDIDAILAEDLDRPLTDDEEDTGPLEIKQSKGRRLTRTKPGSKNAPASIAPARRTTRTSTATSSKTQKELYSSTKDVSKGDEGHGTALASNVGNKVELLDSQVKAKQAKRNTTRKSLAKPEAPSENEVDAQEDPKKFADHGDIVGPEPRQATTRKSSQQSPRYHNHFSIISTPQEVSDPAPSLQNTAIDVQTLAGESEHETDASVTIQSHTKGRTKNTTFEDKSRTSRKGSLESHSEMRIVQTVSDKPEELVAKSDSTQSEILDYGMITRLRPEAQCEVEPVKPKIPKKQTKGKKAATKVPRGKKVTPISNIGSPKASVPSSPNPPNNAKGIIDVEAPPPPQSVLSTPKQTVSPQSSDVENQPPSSRPANLRPPLPTESPSKPQTIRVPLAAATPNTSPWRGNISGLKTTIPWTAVDMETVFNETPAADQEDGPSGLVHVRKDANVVLPSPEKKLTVEQWIQFKAKGGEEILRNECERLVGRFEGQGLRALKTLEGIVCAG